GSTGSGSSTQHVYQSVSAPTSYTVTLIQSNAFGTTTVTETITITESGPVVSFYATPSTGDGAYTATFIDKSTYPTSSYTTFKWTFGDGSSTNFTTSTTTTHQYGVVTTPTTYTAWEIVSTSFGVSSSSQTIFVTEPAPGANG